MTYQEIIEQVSEDMGLPPDIVDRAYKAYWQYIKDSIQALPLKKELTEEEFKKLRPNFNIPSLGKVSCTYQRYKGVKEKFKHIKKLRERNEETT